MNKYLSFGGGVNSVALHLLLLEQGEDFESVFVNHGTDWPETYQYVAMFQWWLKAHGHKPIMVLRPMVGGFSVLYDYLWYYKMIPSTKWRFCTDKFKVRVLLSYFSKPCFSMIGIDYSEAHRAKMSVNDGVENRWPLIEEEINREQCKEIIRSHGLPVPAKSGCYICPYQRKSQWVHLRKTNPCLFRKAVDLENRQNEYRASRGKRPLTISQRRITLEAIVDENQLPIFKEDEYPPCQCGL
jgi:hypothetical protein